MKKHGFILTYLSLLSYCLSFAQKPYTLDSCIKYSFENSPYIKSKQYNPDIAEKDLEHSKGKLLPTISMSANFQVTDLYGYLNEYTWSDIGISIIQPVWQNGKIKALIKMAKVNQEMAGINFTMDRFDMVYTITQQYLNVLRYEKLESLSNEMTERIAINVKSAKERNRIGIARQSDVLRAETRLSDAIITTNQYKIQKETARWGLLKNMGNSSLDSIPIVNILEEIDFSYLGSSIDSLFAMANNNLPELKLAKQSLISQQLKIEYEKRQNLPDLELNGGYSWTDIPVQEPGLYGYIGLSLNFTVFNGLQKKSRLSREKITLNQYKLQKDDLVQSIYREIQQAYLILNEAKQEIDNSLVQIKSSDKNLETVREEYKSGISSMLELLDAENDDFKARQNYINALYRFQLAKASIERKSGIYKY